MVCSREANIEIFDVNCGVELNWIEIPVSDFSKHPIDWANKLLTMKEGRNKRYRQQIWDKQRSKTKNPQGVGLAYNGMKKGNLSTQWRLGSKVVLQVFQAKQEKMLHKKKERIQSNEIWHQLNISNNREETSQSIYADNGAKQSQSSFLFAVFWARDERQLLLEILLTLRCR